MKKLYGVYVVMVTPFDENENIDYDAYAKNIEWYLERGVAGLLPLGSTGEVASMTREERLEVAEFVLEKVAGRVPVCVGTTAETTAQTIEFTQHAKDHGASGVLILPPTYHKPLPEEIMYHFETIAKAVDIPIMIYNNPGTAGVDISLEMVQRLAKLDNIQYIKESTGDLKRIRDIIRFIGDDIVGFCGSEELPFESFLAGAQGWVCVAGNAVPRLTDALFKAVVEEKDLEKAKEISEAILPLCSELERSGKLVQVIKYCMEKMGAVGGYVRAPRQPITAKEAQRLDLIVADLVKFMEEKGMAS